MHMVIDVLVAKMDRSSCSVMRCDLPLTEHLQLHVKQEAFHVVLTVGGFQLPTPLAARAYKSAEKLLDWSLEADQIIELHYSY